MVADDGISLKKIENSPGSALDWFWDTLWKFRRFYIDSMLASVLANLLALASIFFTMNVYDRVVPSQAFASLWTLAIGTTLAIVLEFIMRWVKARLINLGGKKADEAYGTSMVFPIKLDSMPLLAERERQAYVARKQALEQHLSALRRSLVAVTREVTLTAPMVKKGVVSEVELLRLQRQQADLDGQLAERTNRYLTDANNELGRVESDLAQTRELLLAREDAFKRSVIRSPMKGVVKNIQITTVGAVIPAGQNILEIIPTQDEILVEAYVKPAEIAFLAIGQSAMIKLTAYDFNKYGGLKGELVHFSPDTLRDDSRNRKPGANPVELDEGYYRLLIRILDPNEKRHGVTLHPSPGMTATVEILTGKKTVIEYLFRPLQSVTQALRER